MAPGDRAAAAGHIAITAHHLHACHRLVVGRMDQQRRGRRCLATRSGAAGQKEPDREIPEGHVPSLLPAPSIARPPGRAPKPPTCRRAVRRSTIAPRSLANEIAVRQPALIGLQEAFTWRVQTPADGQATPATQVAYDYVPELLAALERRGLRYRAVAQVTLLDFEAPTLLGNDARLTDHGVILARKDVKTARPAGVVFTNLLPVTVLGQSVPVKRGYVAVDAKVKGKWFRFVSTHLESFHPGIRTLQ